MKKLILFVAVWVSVPAGNSWTDPCRATRSDGTHPLKMLIWMILLIGIGLPKSALANCEGTGPCYCTPGTAVCTNTPPPNNSSGGSSSSGGGGFTPQQQQILLQGAASLGNAIGQALRGNPEEDARRQAEQAAQAAEAKRQAAIQERQKEEARDRLLGKSPGGNDSSGLSLMGVEQSPGLELMLGDQTVNGSAANKPNSEKPKSGAYTKGFQEASGCYSQNAGPACTGASADQQQACVADYRAGFELGDKQREMAMQEAYQAGQQAGASGGLANGASDPRAQGPCRTQWVESYNRGHFQGEQARTQH